MMSSGHHPSPPTAHMDVIRSLFLPRTVNMEEVLKVVLTMVTQADLIMALAGSNGGSWSTTYGLKSVLARGMSDTADMGSGSMSMAAAAILGDLQGRSSSSPSSLPLDSSRAFDESSFIPPGNHLGGEKPE
ncbi:unnamed protein product [Cuscuta europaea]|uniref:Uncharacterized protein n=1 Tax=Cuscuta europaea TaxID=41803 RepID=A0A9P1E2N1_CUSEU|nr:unnamed protein product [Cuscuta europaea]